MQKRIKRLLGGRNEENTRMCTGKIHIETKVENRERARDILREIAVCLERYSYLRYTALVLEDEGGDCLVR